MIPVGQCEMTRLWLFAAGLFSLWGQVLLSRELLVSFSGSELPVILGIGILLVSSALGLYTCKNPSLRRARLTLAFSGPALFALVLLASSLRILFHPARGMILPFHQQILSLLIILVPFGFLAGRLFGEISLLYLSEGGTIGGAYILDTLGALAGGALSAAAVRLGVPQGAALCFLCASALALSLVSKVPWKNIFTLASFAALSALYPTADRLNLSIASREEPFLKETRETPLGRLSVSFDGEQAAYFINGSLISESQSTSAEELVHLPAVFCQEPRSVLLVGGSCEGLAREVAKHHPKKIVVIEQSEDIYELTRKYSPGADSGEGAKVVDLNADGRKFLAGSGELFDLIIVSAVEPSTLSGTRFFTKGFFEAARSRLNPGGVLVFRITGSENLWTGSLAERNGSVIAPLWGMFRSVVVIPQGLTLVIASDGNVPSREEIEKRWVERRIEARLASPAYFSYLLSNERRKSVESLLRERWFPATSEERPSAYPLTIVAELSRHFPQLSGFTGTMMWGTALSLAVLLVLFLLAALRARGPGSHVFLVFLSGLWGMVLECALLVAYQVRNGALYNDIGLITALFMAGLSAGAACLGRREDPPGKREAALLILAVILFSLFCPLVVAVLGAGLVLMCVLAFAAGFFAGGVFGLAARHGRERGGAWLRKLYGSDLLGGAVGSIAGSLLFIPFFGVTASASAAALLFVPPLLFLRSGDMKT